MFASEFPASLLSSDAADGLTAIVGARAHERGIACAMGFPAPVHATGYECRLAAGDGRVDFNLAFFPSSAAAVELERRGACSSTGSTWKRLVTLLAPWWDGAPGWTENLAFACLTFNDGMEDSPCVSLCVDRFVFERRWEGGRPLVASALAVDLADRIARDMGDRTLTTDECAKLRCWIDEVPGFAARHLSWAPQRAHATVKVDARLPRSSLHALLERTTWHAHAANLERQVERLQPGARTIQLNLPLHSSPDDALEVEFFTQRSDGDSRGRRAFLEYLVAGGWASREKSRALLDFLRTSAKPYAQSGVVGRSWYAKVRLNAGGPTEAKAYLGLLPIVVASATRATSPRSHGTLNTIPRDTERENQHDLSE